MSNYSSNFSTQDTATPPTPWQRVAMGRNRAQAAKPKGNALGGHPSRHAEVEKVFRKAQKAPIERVMRNHDHYAIFYGLVEECFARRTDAQKLQLVMDLGAVLDNYFPKVWNRAHGLKYEKIIPLAMAVLNTHEVVATLTIGALLGLKPELCFDVFPSTRNSIVENPFRDEVYGDIPKSLSGPGREYVLQDVKYLSDKLGTYEQAICHYIADGKDIFLPAVRVQDGGNLILRIGEAPAPAKIYFQEPRTARDRSIVLLCLDMKVAFKMLDMARDFKLIDRANISVAIFYRTDGCLDALDFMPLHLHDVVLLPETSVTDLQDMSRWADRCRRGGANTVRVYPWPLLVTEGPFDASSFSQNLGAQMTAHAKRLGDIEVMSNFANGICDRAIPIEEYDQWLIDVNIATKRAVTVRDIEHGPCLVRLADIPARKDDFQHKLAWDTLITPQYTTLIWGCSNAGKTWVAIQLTLAMVCGVNAFELPTMAQRRICYLDGEVGVEDFEARCSQLLQDNPNAQTLVKKNLRILPQSGLNILDARDSRDVIKRLREMNADVLVIDNLLSLAPSAAKSNADGLFSFVRQVKQAGVAVVIVHHSGKDGTSFKGSGDLASLSQNVIRLDGREQLTNQGVLSAGLEKACQADGPVVRMTVTKCKAAPQLERKSSTYHLPVNGVWQHIEGSFIEIDQAIKPEARSNESTVVDATVISTPDANTDSLSPDEEEVFNAVKMKKSTRANLEKHTGFGKDKVQSILSSLTDQKRIVRVGKGKATYYRCK